MPRRFEVNLALKDPGGGPSALSRDLRADPNRRRRLDRLTDDFLIRAEKVPGWPRDDAGCWIMGPLGADYLFGQWDHGVLALWVVPGERPGRLTVVRVMPRGEAAEYLRAGPR